MRKIPEQLLIPHALINWNQQAEALSSTCLLALSAAPKVTISGAVKTFSSTPRQSRRYQITDRRRGFCFLHIREGHCGRDTFASIIFTRVSALAVDQNCILCPHVLIERAAKIHRRAWPQSNLYSRAAKTQERLLLRSLAFFLLSAGWFRGAAPSLAGRRAGPPLCYRVFCLLSVGTDAAHSSFSVISEIITETRRYLAGSFGIDVALGKCGFVTE